MKHLCLAIVGPTASGKSKLAIELASRVNGEILCMDSTAIYKGFDIGSAKPTFEQRQQVPHHLVDELMPSEPFSAHHFFESANQKINEVLSRGKLPILVGGTYFYLRALQNGMYPVPPIPPEFVEQLEIEYTIEDNLDLVKMYQDLKKHDPKSAESIHPNDRYRILRALAIFRATGQKPSELKATPSSDQVTRLWMKYALVISREKLNQNIVVRTEKMISDGLVRETKEIMEKWPKARGLGSIGYFEASEFIQKRLTEKQLRNEIIEKTRKLAKRQMTWLRGDPEIRFIDDKDLPRMELEIHNLKFALGESN